MKRLISTMLLLLSAPASAATQSECAKANFKALLSSPATSERLKAMLNETIKENPGKPKEEIVKIFEKRKKAYAEALRDQAVAHAKANCK